MSGIETGLFAKLKRIARESYDRMATWSCGDIAVDGCIMKAPGPRARDAGPSTAASPA